MPISRDHLRMSVRFLYDLQKLRISASNRVSLGVDGTQLSDVDKEYLDKMGGGLEKLEKEALKEVKRLLVGFHIYDKWFTVRPAQRGIGPTMAGLIIAEFDIARCNTVSQMWRYAGLAVIDGHAERRVKGQKTHFDPWLKGKMIKVLGECLIKANSPWKKFYDDYKNRKRNTLTDVCMCCQGKKTVTYEDDEGNPGKPQQCKNCVGTGGPAPWGTSDDHRHNAARRYMVKMVLQDLWRVWRELEGLEVRPPYAEEYLNRKHHVSSVPDVESGGPGDEVDAMVQAELESELEHHAA